MSKSGDAVKVKNKILYIEPNDLPAFLGAKSANGQPLDNITWNPDDLNISVDLQVVIPSRQYNPSELKEYGDFTFNDAKYQSILSGVKLSKTDSYLTDDWTVMSYQEIKNNRAGSKEMLGINSIKISFDSHMYPRVTMNFTDVRGSALMQPQEQRVLDLNSSSREGATEATRNFFASIFKFPYPRFLLSVKGIYGTCVTFVLSVEEFKTQFSSETGNFDVVITFIGNMYGLYTDIPMNYLLVAPYIGSKSGGFTKNEYWLKQTESGGAFHYNENNTEGAPIDTFLEFYTKYHMSLESGDISMAYGENIREISLNEREISFLTGSEGVLEMFECMATYGEPDVKTANGYALDTDDRLSTNVIFYDDTGVTYVIYPTDFVNKFSDAVAAYVKEYPDGFFSKGTNYRNVTPIYSGKTHQFQVNPVDFDADIITDGLTKADSKLLKSIKEEHEDEFKRAFVYGGDFKKDIEAYCASLRSKNDDKMKGASEEVRDHFKMLFGFSFTIENVMRILFAHLDTFIHCFYASVGAIKGTRTLGSLGGFPKNLTDIESSSESTAHVPPYTGFFRDKKDGTTERMYPGDEKKYTALTQIEEVKFVESILNGISSMSGWQEDFLTPEEEEFGFEDVDGGMAVSFSPAMLSDIFYEGDNPYDSLYNENLYPADLIYYLICRIYLYNIMKGRAGSAEKFAEIEADNFINSRSFELFKNKSGFKSFIENSSTNLRNFSEAGMYNLCPEKVWNPFSFKTAPIFKINRDGTKFTVVNKNSDDIPLVFNGCKEPNTSVTSKKTEGIMLSKYSESDVLSFKDAYKDTTGKDAFVLDENYGLKFFIGITENTGKLLASPVIPLSYRKSTSGGYYYYPVFEEDAKKSKASVRVIHRDFDYFKKAEINKRSESGEPEKVVYDSFDALLKDAEDSALWVPIIPYNHGTEVKNLLVNYSGRLNNPVTAEYGGSYCNAALSFLSGLFHGEDPENGKKLFRNFFNMNIKNNTDFAAKVMKPALLYVCGVAYATTLESKMDKLSVDLVDRIESVGKDYADSPCGIIEANYSEDKRKSMAAYFEDWANNEFKANISDPIRGYGSEENYGIYTTFLSTGWTVEFQNEKGKKTNIEVAKPGTSVQKYIISLYRQFEIPFFLSGVNSGNTQQAVDYKAISKFFNIVYDKLSDTEEEEETTYTPGDIEVNIEFNEDNKNAIYYTLKNLYDRWLSMQTSEDFRLYSVAEEARNKKEKMTNGGRIASDRSEFSNFIYVDSFYNDISKKFLVNPEKIFKLLGDHFDGTVSYNILEFIGRICQDNKLLFRCLPVYSNVYSKDTFGEIFTPHSLYDGSSRTGRRIGNTYMIMYTYEPSHFLDIEQDKSDGVNYGNDSFDIADSFGDPTQEACNIMRKDERAGETSYSVCAFGVTPGKQNQSYFSKVNVGMDNPRVTDFAIMNKFQLADMSKRGATANGVGIGQDLYSVYSNRSYDCSVEMLGCANIMPMMYFQLNNVPMFKGTYMITKVEHDIQNNTMTTRFTGTRMPKRYIPIVDNVFNVDALKASINRMASSDMNMVYTVGQVNITVSPFDDTTSFITYSNAQAAQFNGQNTSFPKGKVFYPAAAAEQMHYIMHYTKADGTTGNIVPFGNTWDSKGLYFGGSKHVCATAVQTFLFAGFNGCYKTNNVADAVALNTLRYNAGFNGCNGYKMYNCLSDYGFRLVGDKESLDNGTYKPRIGDVCCMNYDALGHVCMYTEETGRWISDFDQNDWWVYSRQKSKSTLGRVDVLFYRFGGQISTEKKYYPKS